jgi:hypothetical protein
MTAETSEVFDVLCELVDSLPKCIHCKEPATRLSHRHFHRYCDLCAKSDTEDLSIAAAVRKAVALREKEGR